MFHKCSLSGNTGRAQCTRHVGGGSQGWQSSARPDTWVAPQPLPVSLKPPGLSLLPLPPASRPLRPLLLSPDYFPCLQLVPLPAARGGFLEGEGPWNTIQHECLGLPVVRAHKVTPSLAGKHLTPWCSARCAQLWMCAEHLVPPWGAGQALGIRRL